MKTEEVMSNLYRGAEHHRDCVFCRIVLGEEEAEFTTEPGRQPYTRAFVPLNPATEGHTLVIPSYHFATIMEMQGWSGWWTTLWYSVQKEVRRVMKEFHPDGLNVIQSNGEAATQSIQHVHVHVLPRYKGDRMGLEWPR